MELDIHLGEIAQVLANLKELEKGGDGNPILHDFKKVTQAVNYLLEHAYTEETND